MSENKIIVFKKKENYLEYYKMLNYDLIRLYEGIDIDKFTN